MREALSVGPFAVFLISFLYPIFAVFLMTNVSSALIRKILVTLVGLGFVVILLGGTDFLIEHCVAGLQAYLFGTFLNGTLFLLTLILACCLMPPIVSVLLLKIYLPDRWDRYQKIMGGK